MSSEQPKPILEEYYDKEGNKTSERDIVKESTKEEFNNALSLVEQFIETHERLEAFRDYVLPNHKSEFDALVDDYKSLVDILDSETSPIEIIQTSNLSGKIKRHKLERLGVAGEAIRLRKEELMPIKQIAERFGVASTTVSRFFKYYDSLEPSQQSKYQRKSVFDVTERLEELQTLILRNLHKTEGVRDEVSVKWGAELRQTYELALKVAEKINDEKQRMREYEEFKQAVYEILMEELPEKRNKIINKLKTLSPEEES